MKKKIVSCVLSLAMCLSIIAGGTYALFTSEAKTNIAITSGNVEVVAWIDGIEASSFETVQTEKNTFELGGTATYDAASNKLTVDKIAPGDKVKFDVNIENKSNISVKYRVKVAFAGELQNALVAYITLPGDENKTTLTSADVATDWNSFDDTNKLTLPMSVALPYVAGNDNMDKSAEIVVTVEAVQANATELVMIENTRYNSFAEALAAANTGDTIVISGVAEYDFGTASNQTVDAKGVTVSGMDGASLVFSGDGANNTFKNVKLENLTVVDTTTSYAEDSWEFGYLELADITATDVVFANGIMVDGINSFTDCTFTGKTESGLKMYGAWVNDGSSIFTGCTFVGTRGLKAHEAYGSEVTAVTVENCAFNAMSEKPGIALGTLNADTTVTLKNNTFTDTQPGDQNLYIYETDTAVDTFTFVQEKNAAEVNINSVDEWIAMSNAVNGKASLEYLTIKLCADLDFTGYTGYTPVSRRVAKAPFAGTFDGQGHTISGLKFGSYNGQVSNHFGEGADLNAGVYYTFGLFAEAGDGAVFKNFTLSNIYFGCYTSNGGGVVGTAHGDITFENIIVEDALLIQARQTGALVGLTAENSTITIKNCQVNDSAVLSIAKNVGIFCGYVYDKATLVVEGCATTGSVTGTIQDKYNWVEFVKVATLESALADPNFVAATID